MDTLPDRVEVYIHIAWLGKLFYRYSM